jgi:putative tryptophan/tyrosine transport system substrate-binding protein
MRRRHFIAGIAGLGAAWPPAARAQQAGKLPTIGFLGADASAFSPWTTAFVAHLRELGWVESRNVAIEYRWSEGRTERYAEIAAEFVVDPVGSGLFTNFLRPGGNVTGFISLESTISGKWLELLKEITPSLARVAFVFNPVTASYADRILKGENPSELPVQAPVKFEMAINLRTAKTLGLEMPAKLVALADEVIE